MKTNLHYVLSVVLTLAMLFSLVPAVFAEGEAPSKTGIALTDPTAERIFCVVNDLTSDAYGCIEYEYSWKQVCKEGTDTPENINDYINEDGSFTETLMAEIKAEIEAGIADGIITEEDLAGIDIPEDVYDLLYMEIEIIYDLVIEIFNMFAEWGSEEGADNNTEIDAFLAAFTADFPDAQALYDKVIADCFDGNETPAPAEVLQFIMGTTAKIDEDGYLWEYTGGALEDEEGWYYELSDFMVPTGAYLKDAGQLTDERNVYLQLKSAWEAGEIDNTEAFAILFGYAPDMNGDLYSVVPEYDYFYDENGKRITDSFELVNEDGTVLDTGLSVRDYAVDKMVWYYENGPTVDYTEVPMGEFELFFEDLLMSYVPEEILGDEIVSDSGIPEGFETYEEYALSEIEAYIAEWKEFGDTDEYIWDGILWIYAGIEQDFYGYLAESKYFGYAKDAEGNKINIADVMDADGKFLTDGYGAADVKTLMEAYLAEMSTEALLKGDATGDGKINLADATAMLKKIAKWEVEISDDAADTNGDSEVNLADVTMTLKYIADWDVMFVY